MGFVFLSFFLLLFNFVVYTHTSTRPHLHAHKHILLHSSILRWWSFGFFSSVLQQSSQTPISVLPVTEPSQGQQMSSGRTHPGRLGRPPAPWSPQGGTRSVQHRDGAPAAGSPAPRRAAVRLPPAWGLLSSLPGDSSVPGGSSLPGGSLRGGRGCAERVSPPSARPLWDQVCHTPAPAPTPAPPRCWRAGRGDAGNCSWPRPLAETRPENPQGCASKSHSRFPTLQPWRNREFSRQLVCS